MREIARTLGYSRERPSFPLVDFPKKEPLAENVWSLGPLYFFPEPSSAAGGPADVYCLAKMRWVYTRDRQSPLGRPLRVDSPVRGWRRGRRDEGSGSDLVNG